MPITKNAWAQRIWLSGSEAISKISERETMCTFEVWSPEVCWHDPHVRGLRLRWVSSYKALNKWPCGNLWPPYGEGFKHSPAISSSSGEAEYYPIVRGVSIGMSLQEILRGWGLQPKLQAHTDSSAALGTCNRQSLGRSRHVQTRFLWVQEKLAQHEFELVKISTKQNVADLCTKGLPANEMERHMQSMGLEYSHGRAEAAKALEWVYISLGISQPLYRRGDGI